MNNLNYKIFLTTYITYKNIEKKWKSDCPGLKLRTRIANEDVRSTWKPKLELESEFQNKDWDGIRFIN